MQRRLLAAGAALCVAASADPVLVPDSFTSHAHRPPRSLLPQLLGLAVEVLNASPADDAETRYRALVAVGTLAAEHSKV